MKLVLLVGLPGSGKSTWLARRGLPALSSDAVRALLTGDETNQFQNRLVFQTLRRLAAVRAKTGEAVTYIDATALTKWERRCWVRWAELHECEIEAVFFDVPLAECKRRNALRERVVPESAMDRLAAKLVRPERDEGFARVDVVGVEG